MQRRDFFRGSIATITGASVLQGIMNKHSVALEQVESAPNSQKKSKPPKKSEKLWNGEMPGRIEGNDFEPMFHIFLPDPSLAVTGASIVVCPGGGYGGTAIDHEGWQIAQWLNSNGIAAFVLDYRLGGRGYKHPAPLQDAQRAIRTVRARAEEFGVDPSKIGILGFSAGGHLASSAVTHFEAGDPNAVDPIDHVSSRPDFGVLCYPVIVFDMENVTHFGSQYNLLGEDAPKELVEYMSSEKQVTPETPPCYIWSTTGDTGVPPENSILFYLAMRRAGVPAELHIFEQGPHGMGLGKEMVGIRYWPELCLEWLHARGILAPEKDPSST